MSKIYTIGLIITLVFGLGLQLNATENNISFNFNNPCNEEYFPGEIGYDQEICLSNNLPETISSLSLSNDGNGEFEYLWIFTQTQPDLPSVVWLSIPGATSPSYSPPPLTKTTWYRRCTRPVGCDSYGAESNIVKVSVEECIDPCESLQLNIVDLTHPGCYDSEDGRIEMEITGGTPPYTVNWSHDYNNNLIQENLEEGIYAISIMDANSCSRMAFVTLNAPSALKISIEKEDVSCFGGNNGYIHILPEGGTAPYQYLLNGQYVTESVIDNLSAGTYELEVLDSKGCNSQIEVNIEEPKEIIISSITENETCKENDGSIQLEVSGGTAPYLYEWNNAGINSNVEHLESGAYEVYVFDQNECFQSKEFIIEDVCQELEIEFLENMINKKGEKQISLNWNVSNEKSGGIFYVECSKDGNYFDMLGEAFNGQGYNDDDNSYEITCDMPTRGLSFFRIVHINKEGQTNTSQIQQYFFEEENMPKFALFPNPVVNSLSVDFFAPVNKASDIIIANNLGQNVISTQILEGNRELKIDVSNLKSGSYYAKVNSDQPNQMIYHFIKN